MNDATLFRSYVTQIPLKVLNLDFLQDAIYSYLVFFVFLFHFQDE